MTDYAYDHLPNRWVHPDTGVTIDAEDMPAELLPERTTP